MAVGQNPNTPEKIPKVSKIDHLGRIFSFQKGILGFETRRYQPSNAPLGAPASKQLKELSCSAQSSTLATPKWHSYGAIGVPRNRF